MKLFGDPAGDHREPQARQPVDASDADRNRANRLLVLDQASSENALPNWPGSAAVRNAIVGTSLLVLGIAVQVAAARHAPLANVSPSTFLLRRSGWPATTYDVVSVVGWALLIVGIVIVAFALAREVRTRS
ncbi:MAG: hypothetical protein WB805_08320 [Candidatus Dormiibacterota bacterium]